MPCESVVANLVEVGAPKARISHIWSIENSNMHTSISIINSELQPFADSCGHHPPDQMVWEHADGGEQISILWYLFRGIKLQQSLDLHLAFYITYQAMPPGYQERPPNYHNNWRMHPPKLKPFHIQRVAFWVTCYFRCTHDAIWCQGFSWYMHLRT